MKATGIVRKVDALGRVVIPKEIRDERNIKNGIKIEICLEKDMISLQPHTENTAAAGMIRKLDSLGRVVLPKSLCERLHLHEDSPLEIFVEEDKIFFRLYKTEAEMVKAIEDISGDLTEKACSPYSSTLKKESLMEAVALLKQAIDKIKFADMLY